MFLDDLLPKLTDFLSAKLDETGADTFVVGISGGLDSAVVSALCALTEIPTYGLIMPSAGSNLENMADAIFHCEAFKIPYEIKEIAPFVENFTALNPGASALRIGNFTARIRMGLLYDYSAAKRGVVVGTSNLSERMLGYGTIYGDMACAFNPIGEIFKTDLFKFAKILCINDAIIKKAPSADLWANQSDERELGYDYEILDSVLKDIFSRGTIRAKIRLCKPVLHDDLKYLYSSNHNRDLVKFIIKRILKNNFKLLTPNVAKIEPNTLRKNHVRSTIF